MWAGIFYHSATNNQRRKTQSNKPSPDRCPHPPVNVRAPSSKVY